ncbi:MAG: radical SAM family heme chaperone HemW [Planctomycetota bacterium]|nr:radical SAM family heme chaperone HemW [Planctomycetota bacterium]
MTVSDRSTPTRRRAGLYIHIPFCSAICPYCDFAVTTGSSGQHSRYVDRLVSEIELYRGYPLIFDTVYFGGGTPSALEPEGLERILEALRHSLDVATDAWISIEANPEDIDVASLAAWRDLGCKTVSLGVQSFDDAELKFLGRRHDRGVSISSVQAALAAGFEVVSIDLIYGLPASFVRTNSQGAWRRNLEEAINLRPDHVSCYQLTIHEGTPFARYQDKGRLEELPNREQAEAFDLTHEMLEAGGYEAYEVSNFARSPAHRSRHNQRYWNHTPYLGLGLSAHSYDNGRRWWNERQLSRYEERVAAGEKPVAGSEDLSQSDLALETVMLGLRTRRGVDLTAFEERFGVDLQAENADLIRKYVTEGIAVEDTRVLRLTRKGFATADAVARDLRLPGVS